MTANLLAPPGGDPNVTNTNTVKKLVQWIKKLLTPPRGDPNVTETNTVKKLVHSIKKLLTPPGGDPNVTDTNTVKKDQNTVNPSGWRSLNFPFLNSICLSYIGISTRRG